MPLLIFLVALGLLEAPYVAGPVNPVNPYTPMGPGRGRIRRLIAALDHRGDEDGD